MGLEAGSLAPWKLGLVSIGYLALVLLAVYLSSSELRLPIVQYSTSVPTPPNVSAVGVRYASFRFDIEIT